MVKKDERSSYIHCGPLTHLQYRVDSVILSLAQFYTDISRKGFTPYHGQQRVTLIQERVLIGCKFMYKSIKIILDIQVHNH